ncbi:MAG: hypothetical protein WDO06_03675 [Actinomycetota bacterium]
MSPSRTSEQVFAPDSEAKEIVDGSRAAAPALAIVTSKTFAT